jgi:hypothetical protein
MLVKSFTFILSLVCLCAETPLRPISTYSIVALDAETGQLGVAVQSHWFSVGTVVPWAKAGVGAVATQSIAEPSYGPKGLALMEKGTPADEATIEYVDMGRSGVSAHKHTSDKINVKDLTSILPPSCYGNT